ncbi:MAG TPA: PEP/pyruvate-binding domain-containing protein, partial [Candidatus Limnocylindria bacterium]|nr:PEP/pyruvate-binding domain-containing protein [Candidatus Limnocylindria bacterium]
MKSKRAQSYAKDRNIPKHQQTVAVVIQKMVDSDISGVMFTANPINNNTHETLVEVIYGLGELLVQGTVTPESYTLNDTGETIKHTRHRQTKKLIYLKGSNQEVNLEIANEPILSKQQLKDIFKQGKRIEKHYGKPQDIEFTFENNKLFIVQSRPITTLDQKSFGLPEFFSHCIKTLARPATLQRDEIVRFTANAVSAMRVVTLPLEGTTRAYYFEKDDAKKLLQICLKNVASSSQLENHLKAYEALKAQREKTCELIEQKPDNYSVIFKQYKEFLTKLSPFLYTGVAVDAILFPKLKEIVEQEYPKEHIRILDIVSTPKTFHDYQKFRLALCELKISQGSESEIEEVATTYAHVNEYSFVETLLTTAKVRAELGQLTYLTAQAEIEDIKKSIDNKAASIKWLEKTLPEPLATQAKLIKEYSLLRTDRIDQLKKVQTKLRVTFEQLAKDMSKKDGKPWSRSHIANLLDREIDGFVSKGNTPSFDEVHKRLDQKYLYYYMNNTANLLTDSQIVKRARDIVITPETSKPDSLISVGTTAFPGMVSGRVVRITDLKDLSKVQKGDIMVAHVTMPDYTPAMKVAVG